MSTPRGSRLARAVQLVFEVSDGAVQPIAQRHLRLPAEQLPRLADVGRLRWVLFGICVAYVLLSVVLPVLTLVYSSVQRLAVAFPAASVVANTSTWTGAAGDLLWSNPANWSDGVPLADTDAVIPAIPVATIDLGGLSRSVDSLSTASSVTLANGTLAPNQIITQNNTLSPPTMVAASVTSARSLSTNRVSRVGSFSFVLSCEEGSSCAVFSGPGCSTSIASPLAFVLVLVAAAASAAGCSGERREKASRARDEPSRGGNAPPA